MFTRFDDVIEKAAQKKPFRISIAAADDIEVLKSVKMVEDLGLASCVLVGRAEQITRMARQVGISSKTEIVNAPDEKGAVAKAVSIVRAKYADILVKGLVNTSDFLKGVLDRETGIKRESLLSHLAAFEIPGRHKVVFHTDGGINIAPNLEQKKHILINGIMALERMGIINPNVAVLTANERVNLKMPSTVDAMALVRMREKEIISSGIIEGPLALDVAVCKEAAKRKGIDSRISGNVDLFLVPDLDAGNILGKSLIYYAGAKMAGIVLGASNPIVLTSRSETAEGKLFSIALACLAS
ncbi:MAG: phosphate acyltransferase [Tepidanaerobacteraceae bacterium]|jgi:phosphate butyryltransferase